MFDRLLVPAPWACDHRVLMALSNRICRHGRTVLKDSSPVLAHSIDNAPPPLSSVNHQASPSAMTSRLNGVIANGKASKVKRCEEENVRRAPSHEERWLRAAARCPEPFRSRRSSALTDQREPVVDESLVPATSMSTRRSGCRHLTTFGLFGPLHVLVFTVGSDLPLPIASMRLGGTL